MKSQSEVAQSCPTLSDLMDCSLLGSSVHGSFQARVLEWGVIAFSTLPTAAAKLFRSCPTLCDPIDRSPPEFPAPRILQARKNTGVGCHFLLQCMKVKSESEVAQSCPTLSDPMDFGLPDSSVHGFSRQEYWSGVSLPSLALPHYSSYIPGTHWHMTQAWLIRHLSPKFCCCCCFKTF